MHFCVLILCLVIQSLLHVLIEFVDDLTIKAIVAIILFDRN